MSNKIRDLKRSLERHVGGESGEHQPTRVVKPDSKFSRLEAFLRASSSLGRTLDRQWRKHACSSSAGPFQRATVTRKNLAGMQVASLLWF